MAQLDAEFDATKVEPGQPFDTIPSGQYLVQLVNNELRLTTAGTGKYLWLEFEILEGEHHGRRLWDRLNLYNSSQQAVEIAERTLSALCHAAGKLRVSDADELFGIPVLASVRYRPAGKDKKGVERDANNEIRGYAPVKAGPGAAAAPAQGGRATPAPQAPMPLTAPWKAAQRRP